jgi:hypothetical protein
LVINSDKDFVLLGTPWLTRSEGIVDYGKRIMKFPIGGRKSIVIPVSANKKKNDTTTLNLDTIDLLKKKY